jgi:hypothetical protein
VQEVVETLMSQAIDLAESDNLEGALALFQQLSRKDPANAKAYENKGVTLMRLGRYPEARASFMKAKSLMPAANAENLDNNLMALLQHEAYARAGDGDGDDDDEWPGDSAVDTYGNGNEDEDEDGYDDTPILVTMPGRNPSSSSSSSDKNRNNEAASSSTSDDFTQQAIGLAEAGDMVGALPLFSAAAKRDPKNGRMHENLGQYYRSKLGSPHTVTTPPTHTVTTPPTHTLSTKRRHSDAAWAFGGSAVLSREGLQSLCPVRGPFPIVERQLQRPQRPRRVCANLWKGPTPNVPGVRPHGRDADPHQQQQQQQRQRCST